MKNLVRCRKLNVGCGIKTGRILLVLLSTFYFPQCSNAAVRFGDLRSPDMLPTTGEVAQVEGRVTGIEAGTNAWNAAYDLALAASKEFFLSTNVSAFAETNLMLATQNPETATNTYAAVTNDQYFAAWITPTNKPALTIIKKNSMRVIVYAAVESDSPQMASAQFHPEIYRVTSAGVFVEEYDSVAVSPVLGTVFTRYVFDVPTTEDKIIASTDRLVVKVKGVIGVSGSAPTILILTGDGYASGISMTLSPVDVPSNADLGLKLDVSKGMAASYLVGVTASTNYYIQGKDGVQLSTNSFSGAMNWIYDREPNDRVTIQLSDSRINGVLIPHTIDAPIYVTGASKWIGTGNPECYISRSDGYDGRMIVVGESATGTSAIGSIFTLEDIRFDDFLPTTAATNPVIDCTHLAELQAWRCEFTGWEGPAIRLSSGTFNPIWNQIHECWFIQQAGNVSGGAIELVGTAGSYIHDMMISDCQFIMVTNSGIYATGTVVNLNINSCRFLGAGPAAGPTRTEKGISLGAGADGVLIANNTFNDFPSFSKPIELRNDGGTYSGKTLVANNVGSASNAAPYLISNGSGSSGIVTVGNVLGGITNLIQYATATAGERYATVSDQRSRVYSNAVPYLITRGFDFTNGVSTITIIAE